MLFIIVIFNDFINFDNFLLVFLLIFVIASIFDLIITNLYKSFDDNFLLQIPNNSIEIKQFVVCVIAHVFN